MPLGDEGDLQGTLRSKGPGVDERELTQPSADRARLRHDALQQRDIRRAQRRESGVAAAAPVMTAAAKSLTALRG